MGSLSQVGRRVRGGPGEQSLAHSTVTGGDALSAPALLRLVPDLAERDVYLCGPAGMSDAVRRALRDAGLPAECLHEERFVF